MKIYSSYSARPTYILSNGKFEKTNQERYKYTNRKTQITTQHAWWNRVCTLQFSLMLVKLTSLQNTTSYKGCTYYQNMLDCSSLASLLNLICSWNIFPCISLRCFGDCILYSSLRFLKSTYFIFIRKHVQDASKTIFSFSTTVWTVNSVQLPYMFNTKYYI